jgi:ABC-2 type transport system ATP-binding protein
LKPDRVVAPVPTDFDVANLNQLLVKKKFMVSEIRLEQPSLEEYFVNLTGEGFEVVR